MEITRVNLRIATPYLCYIRLNLLSFTLV